MFSQRPEKRRADYANRVLEYTHNRLLLPRVQDVLGDRAVRLVATVENMRVVAPTRETDGSLTLFQEDYENTETIPFIALNADEKVQINTNMPTPIQYRLARVQNSENHPPVFAMMAKSYGDVRWSPRTTTLPGNSDGLTTALWHDAYGRDDNDEEYFMTLRGRPTVVTNYALRNRDKDYVSTTVIHEASHAADTIELPIVEANDGLADELAAYSAQYAVSGQILKPKRRNLANMAVAIEEIRQSVNGDVHNNPFAFEPNQAVQDELEAQGLSYIYK